MVVIGKLRIGTWNMQGKWSDSHAAVLRRLDCDVLLLSEVPLALALDGYQLHATEALMGMRPLKAWAGIVARTAIEPLLDPHPATASANIGGRTYVSSVLPWLLAGDLWPWGPPEHSARMSATVDDLTSLFEDGRAVWGGDWNQPLTGGLRGFSRAAQGALSDAIERCRLQVPTAELGGLNGQASIDHIAVPSDWAVIDADRVPTPGLSDHEAAYWVEVVPSRRSS